MFNPTNLRVNVNTIKSNIEQIQKVLGDDVLVMPVIKGHAYGTGFDAISFAIDDCKIAGVATVAEALKLKKRYSGEILLLYQPCIEDIPYICESGIQVGVSDNFEFLEELNRQAAPKVKIHINVETGSGMLGVQIPRLQEFCRGIKKLENIIVEGIYMHYSCTESTKPEDIEFSNKQSELFEEAVAIAENELGKIPYKHAGCSSAAFIQPKTRYNMVRIGMLIFGYYPAPHLKEYIKVKPALKLTTKITQITSLPAGYSIGYGRTFVTARETKVATLCGGYFDGIHRALSGKGEVIVNGQKAPIIGLVCMDITMIDITDVEGEVKYGDEVTLWDNDIITIHEFVKKIGTNIGECLVHVGQAQNCIVDNEA